MENRLDVVAEMRRRDSLRVQGNLHDMATVMDSIREAVSMHVNPHSIKVYTPLADRIPDIPRAEKDELRKSIGGTPLENR
jgi:hypothetical protein